MKATGRLIGRYSLLLVFFLGAGASEPQSPRTDVFVPDWAADAVWYQILVSRFCNGDRRNDPPGTLDWTDDWARLLPDESPPLRERLFFRRYGGDLQGLRSKLPYLRDLGVNTLYLNPIFQAGSEHKYDTADHRHIDDSFGVADSRLKLARETEAPSTWRWSDSDRVFLDFLADAHARGFRVVLDGVFNHVGLEFWAWRDVSANGRRSRYADWFDITDWGPPLHWRAWDRPDGELPTFRQDDDGLHRPVEAYLFAVARRWMDPDGDGDPADGIDGWRLDAADRVPHGFWRRFRQVVREVNPQAILIGEIWSEAGPWLGGDQFDAVTNYGFATPVLRFLAQDNRLYPATTLVEDLAALRARHSWAATLAMMNLIGSHDTERAVTALTDPQRSTRSADGKIEAIPTRDLLTPDEDAWRRLMLALVVQFTSPGAPVVYYGDEVGMYGGDDPFCRAPMWWSENGPPYLRRDVQSLVRRLADLRHSRVELRRGRFGLILADDDRRLLAFSRRCGPDETIAVVNADTGVHRVALHVGQRGPAFEATFLPTEHPMEAASASVTLHRRPDGLVEVELPGLSAVLLRAPGH